jgi:hypothetical protein
MNSENEFRKWIQKMDSEIDTGNFEHSKMNPEQG